MRLSSADRLVDAIEHARDVTILAYTLRPGRVLNAVEDAARNGAHVTVRLEGLPYRDRGSSLGQLNAGVAHELTSLGADVKLVYAALPRRSQLHAKAALVDSALYLDDINFTGTGNETLLRDSASSDARAVRDAVRELDGPASKADGGGANNGRRVAPHDASSGFAMHKSDALALEAQMLHGARRGEHIVVETETIGPGNPVFNELERLGKHGFTPQLLVSSRELSDNPSNRKTLQRLHDDGVDVRVCKRSEKFAVVGGHAWIGSANATSLYPSPSQLDWGAKTSSRAIISHLRSRFAQYWQAAHPLSA